MKLYLDLDGVLIDFLGGYKKLTGKTPSNYHDLDWKALESEGVDYWKNLEWLPGGKELWKALKGFKPTILSSPSRHESSREGKRIWVRRELGKNVPLILESQKEKYADKDSILIDDLHKNILAFRKKGGLGILHVSAESTLSTLVDLIA